MCARLDARVLGDLRQRGRGRQGSVPSDAAAEVTRTQGGGGERGGTGTSAANAASVGGKLEGRIQD